MTKRDDHGGDRVYVLGRPCSEHSGPVPAIRIDSEGRPLSFGTMSNKLGLEGELCYPLPDGSYAPTGVRSGPAQVATEAYRECYDRIFGGRQTVGQA